MLIVDDNVEVRALIGNLRETWHRKLSNAGVGRKQSPHSHFERPNWTVMDVVMLGMDGLTATRRIKERLPATGIVIMMPHLTFSDSVREGVHPLNLAAH